MTTSVHGGGLLHRFTPRPLTPYFLIPPMPNHMDRRWLSALPKAASLDNVLNDAQFEKAVLRADGVVVNATHSLENHYGR